MRPAHFFTFEYNMSVVKFYQNNICVHLIDLLNPKSKEK